MIIHGICAVRFCLFSNVSPVISDQDGNETRHILITSWSELLTSLSDGGAQARASLWGSGSGVVMLWSIEATSRGLSLCD